MIKTSWLIAIAVLGAALASSPTVALAQGTSSTPEQADIAGPPPARVRIILNGAFWPGAAPTFGGRRILEEYAEQTTIRTGYETDSAFGPELAVQVSVYRNLGILASYSQATRDVSGSIDVSRPHPLHFDRPRTASAEIGGYGYSEGSLHLDLAYGRGVGHLDWSLFAGVTLFLVKADLLGNPTYADVYPYDDLTIASAPGATVESRPKGFNVGGRLDYRLGRSGRFGLGVQLLYSRGTAELQATSDAQVTSLDVGGLQVAVGVRLYF